MANASPKLSPAASGKLKALPLALLGLLPNAFAEIVVEPGQQTTMTQSANGVPVVEITDPNSKGLSHNRFEQFNVSQPGVIFNNSLRDGTSQIGINNHVTHNPNLSREAKAILAEVTGNSPSTLAGTLEVFGGKADFLIANPNGISLNGVSTFNASSLTATTGRVVSGANNLQFSVEDRSGRVIIDTGGVNTEGLSYFDIVAHAVELNDEVGSNAQATDIKIVAGRNTYDSQTRSHTQNPGSASTPAQIAINGSAAGAMHGRLITLISTESGAGVRHSGLIRAAQDINISAAGDVTLNQVNGANNLSVNANALSVNALLAGNDVQLTGLGDITLGDGQRGNGVNVGGRLALNSSQHIAINNDALTDSLSAKAASLSINAATLKANASKNTGTAKAIEIDVGEFNLLAEMTAANTDSAALLPLEDVIQTKEGKLQFRVGGGRYSTAFSLTTTAKLLSAGGIAITAKTFNNHEGIIDDSSTRGISITAETLFNRGVVQTNGDLSLVATALNNLCAAGALIGNATQTLCGGFFASGNSTISAQRLTNEGGLVAQGMLSLELGDGAHTSGAYAGIFAGQDLTISQPQGQADLVNAGELFAGGQMQVNLNALTNLAASTLTANGDMSLQLSKTFSNAAAVSAGRTLAINAEDVRNNKSATLVAGAAATISARNTLVNEKETKIATRGDFSMTSGGDMSTASTINVAGRTALIHAGGELVNAEGSIVTASYLDMKSGGAFTNENGALIFASNQVTLESIGDMTNLADSMINASDNVAIKVGGTMTNASRSLISSRTVTINAQNVSNSDESEIVGDDSLSIVASGNISNESAASLTSDKIVTIQAGGTVTNDKALIAAPTVNINGNNVTNRNSGEITGTTVDINADKNFTSQTGATIKGTIVDINSSTFDASDSNILARDQLQLDTLALHNTAIVHSQHNATVNMKNGSNLEIAANEHGPTADDLLTITTNNMRVLGSINLPGALLVNAAGYIVNLNEIVSGKSMNMNAVGAIDNLSNALIWSAQEMSLKSSSTITNWGDALIMSMKDLKLEAATAITNRAGRIQAKGDISTDTALLENLSEVSGDLKVKVIGKDGGFVHSDNWYSEEWATWDEEYFHTEFWTPRYVADDLQVKQAVIKAGGNLLMNQNSENNSHATVRNVGGLVAAEGDIHVDGSVENLGVSKTISLVDYLKNASAYARWSTSESTYPDGPELHTNIYDLFDKNLLAPDYTAPKPTFSPSSIFDTPTDEEAAQIAEYQRFILSGGRPPGQVIKGTEKWMYSLRKTKTPELNKIFSAVFGADWKNLNLNAMRERWAAFKAAPDQRLDFYADKQAELSAGGAFEQTGGELKNGIGANWGINRKIDVQIGDEKLKTVAGEMDALFKRNSIFKLSPGYDLAALQEIVNDSKIQRELLNKNPLFSENSPPPQLKFIASSSDIDPATDMAEATFKGVYPLYKTRVPFNPSEFYGSEYFFKKINYNPEKTTTVLGDAYFDNELIVRTVENTVGNFFAVNRPKQETGMVQSLMNNAADQMAKLGLVVGKPLTKEQYEKLDSDIVWYEPQMVGGQTVLAPRVYISKTTLEARQKDQHSGALLNAKKVLIEADAVSNINGIVRSTENTLIYAKNDINNVSQGGSKTGIFSGPRGQLVVAAGGQVVNQGGNLQGFQQTVVGGDGVTSSATTGYNEKGNLFVRDNGVMGGGTTEGGTQQKAAALLAEQQAKSAPRQIAPTATDNNSPASAPTDESATPEPKQVVARPDAKAIFEQKKHQAAVPLDAQAQTSLEVLSGGDINLIGARTEADKVTLQSTGDLTMQDIHRVSSDFKSSLSTGFLSYQRTSETFANAKSQGNELNANDLSIRTGGNWNVTGSNVNTQSSDVNVAGNTTVVAGKDLAFYEKVQKTMQLVAGYVAGSNGHEDSGLSGSGGFSTQKSASNATASDYSDMDLNESYGGAPSGANQGRGETVGVRLRIGLEITETKETKQDKVHHNSQLNLGSGNLNVSGTFDLGGADINSAYQLSPEQRAALTADERSKVTGAMPTLSVEAGDIKSTKVQDTHRNTFVRKETFIGQEWEFHSSLLNVASNINKTADKANKGMEVDPGLTATAQAGNATQVAFGDTLGTSSLTGVIHTESTTVSYSGAQNINEIGGNISLTTRQGDIDLNGVNIQGGNVTLDSAGKINQRAALSNEGSASVSETTRTGIGAAMSVSPMGAGIGIFAGGEGYIDWTNANATSFTNGMISGTNVSLKAKSDHSMEGATVNADRLSYNIGGNQSITSKQDTSKMDHKRTNFSVTAGAAISTMGLVPTASVQVSGGADHDNSSLTKGQSGITAGAMNLHVGGDQTLTGAHIISKSADGSYRVDGKSTAAALHDSRDKDGGYGGGGGGLSKSGLISVVVEAGRVDQVKYKADQNSTVDLAGMDMSVGKGVVGELNRDASKLTDVQEDRKIAGTDIRVELAIPSWKKKKKTDDNNPPPPPPPPEVDGESRRPPVIDPDTPRAPVIDVVDGGGADTNSRHMSEHTTGNDLRSALAKINSPIRADKVDMQNNPATVNIRNAAGKVETFEIRNNADLENLNGKIIVTGQQAEGLPVPKNYGKSSVLYIQLTKQYGGGYTYTLTPKKPTKIIDNSW